MMQGWIERLRNSTAGRWYQEQSERDQRLLMALAAFLVAVGFWALIWLPVQDRLNIAESRHARALNDQQWIQSHRDALLELARSRNGSAHSGQALLSTVAASARRSGVTLNRFQPEGTDALAVSLEDVAFGELLIWLERLQQDEGIGVRSATLDAGSAPGRVRARLLLD